MSTQKTCPRHRLGQQLITGIAILFLAIFGISCSEDDTSNPEEDISTTTTQLSSTTTLSANTGPTSPFGTENYPMVQYESSLGFTVSHPPDWEIEPDPELGIVVFQGPPHSQGSSDNFNVVVGEIPNIIPDAYYANELARIQDTFPDANIIEDIGLVTNGVRGRGITFTTVQEGVEVGFSRVIFLHQQKAFEITYTTLPNRLQTHSELISAIFRSLNFS